jgi:hypothetical protein
MRTKIQKFKGFVNELYAITSSSSSSGRTKFIDKIMDEPSSAKTTAAGILLRKELEDLEFEELIKITSLPPWAVKEMMKNPDSEMSQKVNKFRVTMNNLKFLKDKAKEGDLRCEYCDKGPLVIYDFNPDDMTPENISNPKYRFNTKFNPEDGATTDHREPQSRGGEKYDYSNLAVCCYKCNKRKKSLPYLTWLDIIKKEHPEQWIKLTH